MTHFTLIMFLPSLAIPLRYKILVHLVSIIAKQLFIFLDFPAGENPHNLPPSRMLHVTISVMQSSEFLLTSSEQNIFDIDIITCSWVENYDSPYVHNLLGISGYPDQCVGVGQCSRCHYCQSLSCKHCSTTSSPEK